MRNRAFREDAERLRGRGLSWQGHNRALAEKTKIGGTITDLAHSSTDEKRRIERLARRKRAKAIYQAYILAVSDGTPLSVVAGRFGLTEASVKRIVRDRAAWIDIKTAAEVEAVLLVQVSRLANQADDLIGSLETELNVIEKRFKEKDEGDWYAVEQTTGAGKGGGTITRRLGYHRARKMILTEKMKATLGVLDGIRKLLPDNVFNVNIAGPFQKMGDQDLIDRVQALQAQRETLIGGGNGGS